MLLTGQEGTTAKELEPLWGIPFCSSDSWLLILLGLLGWRCVDCPNLVCDVCHRLLNEGSNQLGVELVQGIILPSRIVNHRDHLRKARKLVDVLSLELELIHLLGEHGDLLELDLVGDRDCLNCRDMGGKGLPCGLPLSHKRSDRVLVIAFFLGPLKPVRIGDVISLILFKGLLGSRESVSLRTVLTL